MVHVEKTVFISYRQVDRWAALAIFKDLTQHGYDVFIDYDSIASGDFEHVIVDNIKARAHFVVLLTPRALERCDDPSDWLRREIEIALDSKRNIVPLLLDGFTFEAPIAVQRLQGALAPLRRYQGLTVPDDFFDAAMERLRTKYLAVAVEAVLHPASAHAQQVASELRASASKAAARAPARQTAAEQPVRSTALPPEPLRDPVAQLPGRQVIAPVVPATAKLPPWVLVMLGLAVSVGLVWMVASNRANKEEAPALAAAPALSTSKATVPAEGPTDGAAQNALGDEYYFGQNGRTNDDAEAAKWYRKAAEQGDATGQVNLCRMYLLGRGGLAKDDAEAVQWCGKAATRGYAAGQVTLGDAYLHGRGGLAKDDAEAVTWFRKAAEQDDASGQAGLGYMYEQGLGGLAKDRAEAVKLYRQAATQGYGYAKDALKRLGEP